MAAPFYNLLLLLKKRKEATETWETEAPACNLTYSDITRRKQSAAENAVSASASNQFVTDQAKCKGFALKRLQ